MNTFIDHWLPWLGDLLALGGDILALILVIACVMWAIVCERYYHLYRVYPRQLLDSVRHWDARTDKHSWYAQRKREYLCHRLTVGLNKNFSLVATLIKVCPLLGLLGTVAGMLEVFDALAATGSNNPRSMAAGVSKATLSTLAGMVVAIFGLLVSKFAERRAATERDAVSGRFT